MTYDEVVTLAGQYRRDAAMAGDRLHGFACSYEVFYALRGEPMNYSLVGFDAQAREYTLLGLPLRPATGLIGLVGCFSERVFNRITEG